MRKLINLSVVMAVVFAGVWFARTNARAITASQNLPQSSAASVVVATPLPAPIMTAPSILPTSDNAGVLNERRQFALGMIETGNDDREIGGLGEISRYQIMPSVWRHYSSSRQYQDPDTSLDVARQHWLSLYASFKQQTRREPTDLDMYVLWNTRGGYYASKGFKAARLGPTVRERAQRFANLVVRGAS